MADDKTTKILLVGLGGTGSRIVNEVSKLIGDDYKDVSFVSMDTDIASEKEFRNIHTVRTSTNESIGRYLKRVPNWQEWFPNESLLMPKSLIEGAGQIRATSRLALKSATEKHAIGELQKAITDLQKVDGKGPSNIKIMVVSSVAGGTGSGILLQIPSLLRKEMKLLPNTEFMIRGLFVMPDVFEREIADPTQKENVYVNAYAVLKELNAMNLITTMPEGSEAPFEMKFEGFDSDIDVGNANAIPYNLVFTLDNVTSTGGLIPTINEVIDQAANIVKVQLFSPITPTLFSREDNRFIGLIESAGKNIYGSAGVSKLVYPYEDILNYVATRKVKDMITSDWTYIDELFADILSDFKERQKHNSNEPEPKIEDTIIKFVEDELENPDSQYYYLKKDLLIGRDREFFNKVEDYYEKVKDFVEDVMVENPDIIDAKELTLIDDRIRKALKDTSKASKQIDIIEENLEAYKAEVDKVAKSPAIFSTINAILTDSLNGYNEEEGFKSIARNLTKLESGEYEVFNLFKDNNNHYIHPISARYILSKLIKLIEDDLKETEADLNSVEEEIKNYELAFDNPETEKVEKVRDAYEELAKKKLARWRKGYKEFVENYDNKTHTQSENIDQYSRLRIKKEVFSRTLLRLKALLDEYNKLFRDFKTLQQELNREANELANINKNDTLNQYVMASPEEKERIYKAVNNVFTASEEFNSQVYQSLNEALYVETLKILNNEKKTDDILNVNKDRANREKTPVDIFKEIVIPRSKVEILDQARHLVDRNIIQALFSSVDSDEKAKDKITQIYNRSQPLISYTTESGRNIEYDEGQDGNLDDTAYVITYWGMNPKVEDTLTRRIDESIPEYLRQADSTSNPELSISEYYSPYELICYNSVYGLRATELNRVDDYYDSYQRRLNILNNSGVPEGVTKDKISTVSPHLNIHWHEILPDISAQRNLDEKKANNRALLLSLIYDDIVLAPGENDNLYYLKKKQAKEGPIKFEDVPLTKEDSFALVEKAQAERNFVRNEENKFDGELIKDLETIKSNKLKDTIEDSKFYKGITGTKNYGINFIDLLDAVNESIDGLSDKQEEEIFVETVNELIREFAQKASKTKSREIEKKLRKDVFNSSEINQSSNAVKRLAYEDWLDE